MLPLPPPKLPEHQQPKPPAPPEPTALDLSRCSCGYTITGLRDPVCPECGRDIPNLPIRRVGAGHSLHLNFAVAFQLVANGLIIAAGHGIAPLFLVYLWNLPFFWNFPVCLGYAALACSVVTFRCRWGDVKVASAVLASILHLSLLAVLFVRRNDLIVVATAIPFLAMTAWVLAIGAAYFGHRVVVTWRSSPRLIVGIVTSTLAPFLLFLGIALAGRALGSPSTVTAACDLMICAALISPGVSLWCIRRNFRTTPAALRYTPEWAAAGVCLLCWCASAALIAAARWFLDIR